MCNETDGTSSDDVCLGCVAGYYLESATSCKPYTVPTSGIFSLNL